MRRVVVTGLGLVTPLASGVEATWSRLVAGESGAGPIDRFDASAIACRIAAEVPWTDGTGGGKALVDAGAAGAVFNADDWVEPKERRRMDDFIVYGLAAAQMAFADSGVELKTAEDHERIGVTIGAGIGGLPGIEKEALNLAANGPRRVSPFFITGRLINLVSGQVSIRLGLKGPNHAVVTACSSGAHAIGDAAHFQMRHRRTLTRVDILGLQDYGQFTVQIQYVTLANRARDHFYHLSVSVLSSSPIHGARSAHSGQL